MPVAGAPAYPRRRLLGDWFAGSLGLVLAIVAGPAVADRIDKLLDRLRGARAYKVRIQAATVLAKLLDPRVVPALGRTATTDRHPYVRIYTLRLLARLPDGGNVEGARAQIRRALQDRRGDVRAEARRALAEIDLRLQRQSPPAPTRPAGGPLRVFVGSMGDRSGQASPELRARLKAALQRHLRSVPGLAMADRVDAGVSYMIDATIAVLSQTPAGTDMEITCAVQLLVSRPPRGIVMVASGEASVLKPRSQFRPTALGSLQVEALDHAVDSAYENLGRFMKAAAR